MGQYYKPVNLDRKEFLYSFDYNAMLKLMEHSYQGNYFVNAAEGLLSEGGGWYKTRLVWAGDYMDDGIFGAGEDENLHSLASENNVFKKVKPKPEKNPPRYIVNHSKKEYVDKEKVPKFEVNYSDEKSEMWQVHPLPLLTASGNGRGGGDYEGPDEEKVGMWAGDIISLEDEAPADFQELIVKFIEEF